MNRLKEIRRYLNLTQKGLAKILGVKQNTISYWENGKRQIDIQTARKISGFAGCSVEYLIGLESETNYLPILEELRDTVPADAITATTGSEEVAAEYKNCFAIRVKEDDMDPLIKENDIVIIKPTGKVTKGDIVLVRVEEGKFVLREYVKFASGIALFAHNKKHSPVFYATDKKNTLPIKIIGKVIEQRRKF